MNIPSKYNPAEVEEKWYKYWLEKKYFESKPDNRKPYVIVMPPPNVTGVLHMGHMLNNTIQDILIRRARMKGYNALWVPGIDHASIATEARVVAHLKSMGINKADLTREEFLKHAWEWKEKHGGIILEQLKKLGTSCDWSRTKFTMDDDMSESVIKVFVKLYRKGLIYRGLRMVNWDPQAKTAISDEEVIYQEVKSKLYYVKYKIEGEDNYVTIATTRPETILGDTAICINPGDERYKNLKNKRVYVPLINRLVPVIEDSYVDPEFGTGVLKITPAHDANDYDIGLRHNLEIIDIFNEDATLNEKAQLFIGVDRFEARKLIVEKLKEEGLLEKEEDYINKVGFSERTNVPIEPRLSKQWFLKMKELAQPALENVMNDNIRLIPPKFKNIYRHWMENVKDWCISRQLWWGHRIPAYYIKDSEDFVVAENINEALILAKEKTGDNSLTVNDLHQDDDVLDTWFSSWLWPISVFDGIRNPDNPDIKYYYPTDDLVTAPEILFFWVARMIIAGYEFMGEKPFKNVYLTGIVRDNQRRKMSKSLGNSPDPLDLIEKYSADGVRVGMLLCSPAGNDLLFDESLPEQGRNFANKIWNAFRLVKSWNVNNNLIQPDYSKISIKWFENRLNKAIEENEILFEQYRISDALMNLYRLFWEDFASWYLEIIKPENKKEIDSETYNCTILFFEKLLKLLHPFMPFITEEIWHLIKERKENESIMIQCLPSVDKYDSEIINKFEIVKEIIGFIRNTRQKYSIPNADKIELLIRGKNSLEEFFPILFKQGNLLNILNVDSKPDNAVSLIMPEIEFYIKLDSFVDKSEEIKRLEKELDYMKGFLQSVIEKLNNKRFIENAPPQVIEKEKKKKQDAESKIKLIEEQLKALNNS